MDMRFDDALRHLRGLRCHHRQHSLLFVLQRVHVRTSDVQGLHLLLRDRDRESLLQLVQREWCPSTLSFSSTHVFPYVEHAHLVPSHASSASFLTA